MSELDKVMLTKEWAEGIVDTEFTDEAWGDIAEILTQAAILIRAEVADEIFSEIEDCMRSPNGTTYVI